MKWAGHKPIKCFWCEVIPDRWWATVAFDNDTKREVGGFKTESEAHNWLENERLSNPTVKWTKKEQSYRLPDGSEKLRDSLPPGALFHDFWSANFYKDNIIDGICLSVILPNGKYWCVDSRASNCNAPEDKDGKTVKHRCWVREGDPRTGNVDVPNKRQPGGCTMGAGSIGWGGPSSPDYYHGFLRKGYLVPA